MQSTTFWIRHVRFHLAIWKIHSSSLNVTLMGETASAVVAQMVNQFRVRVVVEAVVRSKLANHAHLQNINCRVWLYNSSFLLLPWSNLIKTQRISTMIISWWQNKHFPVRQLMHIAQTHDAYDVLPLKNCSFRKICFEKVFCSLIALDKRRSWSFFFAPKIDLNSSKWTWQRTFVELFDDDDGLITTKVLM